MSGESVVVWRRAHSASARKKASRSFLPRLETAGMDSPGRAQFAFMSSKTLLHIVPTVPPAFDGLGDYCYKLWQHWPQPRPDWHCLAARIPPGAQAAWPQAHIAPFELSKSGLQAALDSSHADCVVLHYVGYAYQKRGVPWWLPSALRAWKARTGGRLCVMFHELYAVGSPRRSAFWLQPLAQSIVAQLEKMADVWITSNEDAATRLVHKVGADIARGRMIPVGSNIEPTTPVNFERPWPLAGGEKLRIAVFGLPSTRLSALRCHRHLLRELCQRQLVGQISLIGKSQTPPSPEMSALQAEIAPADGLWKEFLDLAPAQLSEVLRQNDLSLSFNPPQLLTKSGSYAAACVHGLPTICLPQMPDGLPPSGMGDQAQMPYLSNDDENARATAEFLLDGNFVADLRANTKKAALGRLSWTQILRDWNENVGL